MGTDVSCNGGSDGAADLTVTGGTTPYTFDWSNGSASEDLTGLTAGTFIVTVTDANGCEANTSIAITEPSAFTASIVGTDVSCNEDCDGTADLTLAGGIAPFTFLWSNGATSQDLTGLCAGSFSVDVTDNNGCTVSAGVGIAEPAALSTSTFSTNVSCTGNNDGAIDLTVTGGTTPYTFLWSPGGETTEDITGLSAAIYSVLVTDINGCQITSAQVIVGTDTQPVVDAGPDQTIQSGQSTVLTATVTSGGTAPFTFLWSTGGTTASISVSPTVTTSFYVVVTDALGCQSAADTVIVNVTQPGNCSNFPCKKNKVEICHIPPGNPSNAHTICISANAVPAHLANHADYCGPCVQAKLDGSEPGDDNSGDGYDPMVFENRHSLQNAIEIYPNPNAGEFTLLMLPEMVNTKTSVFIYNVLGEVVYTNEDIQNHYSTIDISNHPKGVYLIKVINQDEIFVGKVIYQ